MELYESFQGNKWAMYYKELFSPSLYYMTQIQYVFNFTWDMSELRNNFEYHKLQSLSVYQNPTGVPGCNLKDIPRIYFYHPLLRPFYDSNTKNQSLFV